MHFGYRLPCPKMHCCDDLRILNLSKTQQSIAPRYMTHFLSGMKILLFFLFCIFLPSLLRTSPVGCNTLPVVFFLVGFLVKIVFFCAIAATDVETKMIFGFDVQKKNKSKTFFSEQQNNLPKLLSLF